MEFFEIISSYFFHGYYFTDCNLIIRRRIEETFSFCFFFLPLDSGGLALILMDHGKWQDREYAVLIGPFILSNHRVRRQMSHPWCFWEFIFIFIRQSELNILIKLSEVSCLLIIEIVFYKESDRGIFYTRYRVSSNLNRSFTLILIFAKNLRFNVIEFPTDLRFHYIYWRNTIKVTLTRTWLTNKDWKYNLWKCWKKETWRMEENTTLLSPRRVLFFQVWI